MNSDKKIWSDFIKGESYALSHIYFQHVQGLFRYGKKFCNDDELIKDTIQDLFFDLLRTRSNLGKTDNINYYLITSFRRKLFKNIKSQAIVVNVDMEQKLEADIDYSVEQKIINNEEVTVREKAICKGLSELTPKQREILYYKFTCGFEYDQICEIMSLKYDSARKQVSRALKALEQCLSKSKKLLLFFWVFPRK